MSSRFITISTDILQNKDLTPNEKFVLAEIEQLCSLEHECYPSNGYFADLIGISKSNASRTIANLQEKGYIEILKAQETLKTSKTRIIRYIEKENI